MTLITLLALTLSPGAHADNGWTVHCEFSQAPVYVQLDTDYTENFVCNEGNGNFNNQYLPAFKNDTVLHVGGTVYKVHAGEPLGLQYQASCDAAENLMRSDRPDIAFSATDESTGSKVRFVRLHLTDEVEIYYDDGHGQQTVECKGPGSR